MDCYLSITKMARLRNVTTETLRYYDRIGLLKPDYLDKNGVRFYSVLKYEQLETIKELQQLGLNLKEIANYLSDRRIDTSYDLLQKQQKFCEDTIRYYQALHEKIDRKLSLLSEQKQNAPIFMTPELVELPRRICISSESFVQDEISLSYACMELESQIKKQDDLVPIYASDCYAGQFSLTGANTKTDEKTDEKILAQTKLLFILQQHKNQPANHPIRLPNITALPAGRYLHLYSSDSFWQRAAVRDCFLSYAEKKGLHLCDKAIVISKIDYSITDIPDERLYEFQVQVL